MLDYPGDAIPDPLAAIRRGLAAAARLPDIFAAGEAIRALAPAPGAAVQRIAVIGPVTVDYLARAIGCAVVLEGAHPLLHEGLFGAHVQDILDPASGLHRSAPDITVIAADWRDLVTPMAPGADPAAAIAAKVALWRELWARLPGKIIQHTLVAPHARLRGPADAFAPASPASQVAALNAALYEAGRGRVHWVLMDRFAQAEGVRKFAAEKHFFAAKLSFDPRALPGYVAAFRGAWRSACGRAKKVLALDLDNTLWGGVIGDDGVDGIALGAGTASGEAFAAFQAYAAALAARGVILAVCSKNDPEIAASGFDHPASVLARKDFAAFECSWADKAGGLRRIAEMLNVGLDAIVFVDDNPAECVLVRAALPEVAVVELGDDPADFIDRLDAGCWFDLETYTPEDLSRTGAYAARAAAQDAAVGATDMDGYLRSLAMTGRIGTPADADIARCAQLEQKTNQFNTMTRRYSEPQLRALLSRDDAVVLCMRLADRFGDHGLIATLIALHEGDGLRIDSWLMSCRVFSRGAEQAMLASLLARAREEGALRIVGTYEPTGKNGVVAGLYDRLGFARDGAAWTLDAASAPPAHHIALD